MKCPGCDGKLKKNDNNTMICTECGGLISENIYLGDSYKYVLPFMTKEKIEPENTRYYDFTCLGSSGITRRHGWYDPKSKLIVQVG